MEKLCALLRWLRNYSLIFLWGTHFDANLQFGIACTVNTLFLSVANVYAGHRNVSASFCVVSWPDGRMTGNEDKWPFNSVKVENCTFRVSVSLSRFCRFLHNKFIKLGVFFMKSITYAKLINKLPNYILSLFSAHNGTKCPTVAHEHWFPPYMTLSSHNILKVTPWPVLLNIKHFTPHKHSKCIHKLTCITNSTNSLNHN